MFSTSLYPSVKFPALNMQSKLGEIVTLTGKQKIKYLLNSKIIVLIYLLCSEE